MESPGVTSLLREEVRANLRLAIPIIAAQLGSMTMGLVDTAIVGRVGECALAGVALGNTLVFAVALPALGVFMALEPIAAQALGAGERARARAANRAGIRLALFLSLPVALIAYASLALLPLLRVDEAAIPDARAYLFARLPSLLPFFLYISAKTYQQAAGRTRAAVEAVIVANVVHAIAAWFAVHGAPSIHLPAFGAAGAGIATSVSSVLLAYWMLRANARGGAIDKLRDGEVDDDLEQRLIEKKLLRLGLPIGMQLGAEVGVFSLVALLMGRIGGRAVAAHQIAIGLASLSFMGALGVAQSTSVRVGTAIGEGSTINARRAGLVGIMIGIAIMAFSAVLFATAPSLLARAFTPERPVIEVASMLIRIAALFQLADGAQVVAAGALRGAADTRWPLALNVIVHWGFGVPIGWMLAFRLGMGAPGLWLGLTAGLIVIAGALIARFVILTRLTIARV
jgi:multidrug resistance protein, MATE family